MNFKPFKVRYQNLIFFVLSALLPMTANSTTGEVMVEKHIGVAMRMIGHEVLMSLGDCESRILPIEKINTQNQPDSYRISFESEFGFDPEDIASIIDRVIKETRIASDYLVEVEQCEMKEIVHSFEIRNAASSILLPCKGRALPVDCYSLLITILDGAGPAAHSPATTTDGSSTNMWLPAKTAPPDGTALISSATKKENPFTSALLIVSLLILLGVTSYFIKKKNAAIADPDLILIGASRFDKRNMALSYENKRVELSNKEAELLSLLHSAANEPLEREVILQKVWGDDGDYIGRTLDVFISKLRKKLEEDASVKIVNIRGIGYKLVMDVPR